MGSQTHHWTLESEIEVAISNPEGSSSGTKGPENYWATIKPTFGAPATQFMVKTGWLALLLVGVGFAYYKILVSSTDTKSVEVSFAADRLGIILQRRDADRIEIEKLFILHPQGWVNTGIRVHLGDSLVIAADGRINIAVHRLMDGISRRRAYEASVRKSLARAKPQVLLAPEFRPEKYYSPAQIDSIRGQYPWSDPGGIPNQIRDPVANGRTEMKIAPGENFGKLLGLIRSTDDDAAEPTRTEFGAIFPIGRHVAFEPTAGGYLWLVVNDVWTDYVKGGYPRLFFDDNVGSFGVRVAVRRPRRDSIP